MEITNKYNNVEQANAEKEMQAKAANYSLLSKAASNPKTAE